MKKLMFAFAVCGAMAFAAVAEGAPDAAAKPECSAERPSHHGRKMMNPEKFEETMAKRLGMSVEEFRKLTPDERKAKMNELREKNKADRAKREAELAGVPLEDWNKLSPADRKAKMRDALDARAAQKKGISVEEFRKQRDEKDAAQVGMSVGDWLKLSEKERHQKRFAAMRADRARRAAAKAEKKAEAK